MTFSPSCSFKKLILWIQVHSSKTNRWEISRYDDCNELNTKLCGDWRISWILLLKQKTRERKWIRNREEKKFKNSSEKMKSKRDMKEKKSFEKNTKKPFCIASMVKIMKVRTVADKRKLVLYLYFNIKGKIISSR